MGTRLKSEKERYGSYGQVGRTHHLRQVLHWLVANIPDGAPISFTDHTGTADQIVADLDKYVR